MLTGRLSKSNAVNEKNAVAGPATQNIGPEIPDIQTAKKLSGSVVNSLTRLADRYLSKREAMSSVKYPTAIPEMIIEINVSIGVSYYEIPEYKWSLRALS